MIDLANDKRVKATKKRVGSRSNYVLVSFRIQVAQDEMLTAVARQMNKPKVDVMRDAFGIYLATMQQAGLKLS